jgi:hypothetical protein
MSEMIGTCCHLMRHVAYCIDWQDGEILESIVVCAKCYNNDFKKRNGIIKVYRWAINNKKKKQKEPK